MNGRSGEQAKRRHPPIPRAGAAGSALILTVVLTSLLAIVGVLFIMTTRLDKLGSSAALDSEQLDLAVGSVVSQISQTLADDVPGMSGSKSYYDYPDANNPWLADLEPYKSGSSYMWRQVTNLTGQNQNAFEKVGVSVVAERAPIVDPNSRPPADADGDGVSDARWYRLPGVVTTKGRPVYAAVRIIDNGGMLNLNTARAWGSNGRHDGTSQLQINLADTVGGSLAGLDGFRDPNKVHDLDSYERNIIWQYWQCPPWPSYGSFRPFDLSDEFELRYRFILNREGVDCRAEKWGQFRGKSLSVPASSPSDKRSDQDKIIAWGLRVMPGTSPDPNYALCHLLTTYNMDRILTPDSRIDKKINVNTISAANQSSLRDAIKMALSSRSPADPCVDDVASQITANLLDYVDQDDKVTVVTGYDPNRSAKFYGYERPCLCLSEVADCLKKNSVTGQVVEAAAIELFKPFIEDGDPDSSEWQVEVVGQKPVAVTWKGDRRFHVLGTPGMVQAGMLQVSFDPNESKQSGTPAVQDVSGLSLRGATVIRLNRKVGNDWVVVDSVTFKSAFAPAGDPNADTVIRVAQRDITDGRRIQRLWGEREPNSIHLGNGTGNFVSGSKNLIQAHPTNKPLVNIGELGMIFRTNACSIPSDSTPEAVLVDLANPAFADLFNYLTVMDPSEKGQLPGETRITGRININTAPWPVLAALPWIQYVADKTVRSDNGARAQAIVKYRDKYGPFRSIGDLMRPRVEGELLELQNLQTDKNDNFAPTVSGDPNGPDLTPDKVQDDEEERDILFTRISDLVTVRSDVFTAYILVRIGEKGPQRRMIAILDRSQAGLNPDKPDYKKVRLVALHPVADPW